MAFLLKARENVVTSPVVETPLMTSSAEEVVCELSSSLAVVLAVPVHFSLYQLSSAVQAAIANVAATASNN